MAKTSSKRGEKLLVSGRKTVKIVIKRNCCQPKTSEDADDGTDVLEESNPCKLTKNSCGDDDTVTESEDDTASNDFLDCGDDFVGDVDDGDGDVKFAFTSMLLKSKSNQVSDHIVDTEALKTEIIIRKSMVESLRQDLENTKCFPIDLTALLEESNENCCQKMQLQADFFVVQQMSCFG